MTVSGPAPTGGRVVVGVNGSAKSAAALGWAAAEAALRGAELLVVHAWQVASEPPPPEHVAAGAAPIGAYHEAVRGRTRRFVADVLGEDAGRHVAVHTPHHTPARALLDAVDAGDLLVLGTPGRGRVAAVVLGSVAEQAVHCAPCPVVVVPSEEVREQSAAAAAPPAGP